MKSLKITINNSDIINLNCFYSNVILQRTENFYYLLLFGGDELKNRFRWKTIILREGDKINIKVVNLDIGTAPNKKESVDIHSIKTEFEDLKLELKNKGVI
ncbi:hypothetical protein [Sphingobacterium lumbrici]|uniref:hypothetical protein n=1 Tax=Sphingobacterium lumbrici TaxID=2559600 RepID=UPI001127EDC6|nr:hypothetical protein [Sphingobacterium lumbrici]